MDQTAVKPETGRNGREVCPICEGNKSRFERLCNTCYKRLPEVTQKSIMISDAAAESRMMRLVCYVENGLQLEDIRIYE